MHTYILCRRQVNQAYCEYVLLGLGLEIQRRVKGYQLCLLYLALIVFKIRSSNLLQASCRPRWSFPRITYIFSIFH